MAHPCITLTTQAGIATVLIDRAEKRNCLDLPMWVALREAMEHCTADATLRCVVIRGAGGQAFSAGADIAAFERERGTPRREEVYNRELHLALQSVRRCLHPVVAALTGWTMGGGCGIATMCDFRIGGPGTRMGIPARSLGIFYAYAEIEPILQSVGYAVTAELLIEGRVFTGEEALAKGLLSRLVPDEAVVAEAYALAGRIAAGSPLSNRFHKRAMQELLGQKALSPAQQEAEGAFAYTEDFRNAAAAFLARRQPVFEGR